MKIKQIKKDLITEVMKKFKKGGNVNVRVEDVLDSSFGIVTHHHFGIGSEIQDVTMSVQFEKDGKVSVFCEDCLETNMLVENCKEYEEGEFDDDGYVVVDINNFGISLLIYLLEE